MPRSHVYLPVRARTKLDESVLWSATVGRKGPPWLWKRDRVVLTGTATATITITMIIVIGSSERHDDAPAILAVPRLSRVATCETPSPRAFGFRFRVVGNRSQTSVILLVRVAKVPERWEQR